MPTFPSLALAAVLGGSLLLPATAAAQASPQPFAPYDGSNPFACELQDVGTGTDYPDPGADPFCVRYDKTNQNVTGLGLVTFLSQEPARTAAAAPKCFYYQQDEWQGWIAQGGEPELWHWVGGYFFDKARGVGGVSARAFRVGGSPMNGKPYAPPEYHPYMDETGGGGMLIQMETIRDPACAAMVDEPEERAEVYRDEPALRACIDPGGKLRPGRAGEVELGMPRERVRELLGEPTSSKGSRERWCVIGGDYLQVAYAGPDSVAGLILTSVRGHARRGIGPGTSRERAERRLDLSPLFRMGATAVLESGRGGESTLLAGTSGGHVRWLAIADPELIGGRVALKRALSSTR